MRVQLQPRDREIMLALWRFDFLTTSQVASTWWPGRDVSRARGRLAQLEKVKLLARFRPTVLHGTHEWIYRLTLGGFDALRRDGADVTQDARWSERRLQMRRVDHVLRVNGWLIAYSGLIGNCIAAWCGPREARPVSPPVPAVDVGAPMLMSPDAAAIVRVGGGAVIALLVEFTRHERPVRLAERLRRHAALIGPHARSAPSLAGGEPVRGTIFVAPTLAAAEQLVRVADREIAGGTAAASDGSARERIIFCAESDALRHGSKRAWMLPAQPPERRASPELTALEVSLPG